MSYFIGIDVGGTTTTVAVGSCDREVLKVSGQFETRSADGPEATIAAILTKLAEELDPLGGSLSDVEIATLATPGPATMDGVILKTPNFDPELWNRCPFRAMLEAEFRKQAPNVQVPYVGDGQAAALGEFAVRTGAISIANRTGDKINPAEIDSLFMVIVGTGLGGGFVRKGKVVQGSQGRAGHVGHLVLPRYAFRHEHDQHLLVGNAYCTAESAISLTSLAHQLGYRLTLDDWKSHPLNEAPGSTRDKAKKLRELAAEGDDLALELFDDQARALGITLLNVNYLGDYDALVIGGGVCDLTPELRERYRLKAEEGYRQFALDGFGNLEALEFSTCGDDAPVLGALAFAYELKS